MTRDQEPLILAMDALAHRIAAACEKSWSAESVAVFVDSLIRTHERFLLAAAKGGAS
jgi:hypothetical protein